MATAEERRPYILVERFEHTEFINTVNYFYGKGYRPQGGVSVAVYQWNYTLSTGEPRSDLKLRYSQAMVLPEPPFPGAANDLSSPPAQA